MRLATIHSDTGTFAATLSPAGAHLPSKRAGDRLKQPGRYRVVVDAYPNTDLTDNAMYWIGESHYAQKKFKEAIADYTKAIALDPKDPEGYRRRALAHTMAGDSKAAGDDFRALLKIKPADTDAQSRLKALETRANASPTPVAPGPPPAVAPSMAPPAASPH